jgi:hypothetical protein
MLAFSIERQDHVRQPPMKQRLRGANGAGRQPCRRLLQALAADAWRGNALGGLDACLECFLLRRESHLFCKKLLHLRRRCLHGLRGLVGAAGPAGTVVGLRDSIRHGVVSLQMSMTQMSMTQMSMTQMSMTDADDR